MSVSDLQMLQGLIDMSGIRATDEPLREQNEKAQPVAGNRKERRAAAARARKRKKK